MDGSENGAEDEADPDSPAAPAVKPAVKPAGRPKGARNKPKVRSDMTGSVCLVGLVTSGAAVCSRVTLSSLDAQRSAQDAPCRGTRVWCAGLAAVCVLTPPCLLSLG